MQDGWVLLGKTGRHVWVMQIPLTGGECEILITNLGEAEWRTEHLGNGITRGGGYRQHTKH